MFLNNGNIFLDSLLIYYKEDNKSVHTHAGQGSSQMGVEQGFYGLADSKIGRQGKPSLYRLVYIVWKML